MIAACTSCSATSRDRSSEKRSVITEAPPELLLTLAVRHAEDYSGIAYALAEIGRAHV